jgi:penicillin amidase
VASDYFAGGAHARGVVCACLGVRADDSVGATIYALLTNAALDGAMSDDLPGGKDDDVWRFAQALFQFEANVQRMWRAPADAPFWDDVRTEKVERRNEILEAALVDAVATGRRLLGSDLGAWKLGYARPFTLTHAFAAEGGPLGVVLNSAPLSIGGDTETPFKQQFLRSDRDHMRPAVGPLVRLTVDLGDPWSATYSLAGGESGWPQSPWYANLLDDWRLGKGRPLTPRPLDSDVDVKLVPKG